MTTKTALDLEPLDASFGAIVRSIELSNLDDARWSALHRAWIEYGLLIFPGQFLSTDQQNDFALCASGTWSFAAPPICNVGKDGTFSATRRRRCQERCVATKGGTTTRTYMPVQAKGAVFTAEIVPSEGARRPAGPTCGPPTRRSTTRPGPGPGSAGLPLAALQQGSMPATCRRKGRRAATHAYGLTISRCRSGRWSRSTPTPGAPTC